MLSLGITPLLYAADNDQTRFHVSIRVGAVGKSTHQVAPGYQGTLGGEDVIGLLAGMNFNKYVGAELSMDRYEFILDSPKGEKAAEYSVSPFLRACAPSLSDVERQINSVCARRRRSGACPSR